MDEYKILADAREKHNIDFTLCPGAVELVRYARHIGFTEGWNARAKIDPITCRGEIMYAYVVKYSVIEKAEKDRVQNLSQWHVTGNDFLKSMLEESKTLNRPENTCIVSVDNSHGIGVPELVIESVGGAEKAAELDLIIGKIVFLGKLLMASRSPE